MAKIKLEKESFTRYIDLMCLKGDIENKEAVLNVQKDKITSRLVSTDNTLAVESMLKGTFVDRGEVGVGELPKLAKFLSAMGDKVKAEFLENKLNLSSNKTKISLVLQKGEYIVNRLEDSKFNKALDKTKGYSFTLPKETQEKIVEKFNLIKSADLLLEADDGVLSMTVVDYQNETQLTTDFDVEGLKGIKFVIRVSRNFIDLLSCVEDDVTIMLAKEKPVVLGIKCEQENYRFQYLLTLSFPNQADKK